MKKTFASIEASPEFKNKGLQQNLAHGKGIRYLNDNCITESMSKAITGGRFIEGLQKGGRVLVR